MSLNHIEALSDALASAKDGELSSAEFQVIVLQGLISLKVRFKFIFCSTKKVYV